MFKGAECRTVNSTDESNAFAAALAALGVKGDRVALLLPNCPQFLIAEFGVWKAGAVVVALNPTYSERELEQTLDSMRVDTVVTLTLFYERLSRVQGRTSVRHSSPRRSRNICRRCSACCSRCSRNKEGHRITLQTTTSGCSIC